MDLGSGAYGAIANLGENDRCDGLPCRRRVRGDCPTHFSRGRYRSSWGWEPAADAQARIVGAVEQAILQTPEHVDIAIVGHGGTGTLLYCQLAGVAIAAAIKLGSHSFRATEITAYLQNGGTLRDGCSDGETPRRLTQALMDVAMKSVLMRSDDGDLCILQRMNAFVGDFDRPGRCVIPVAKKLKRATLGLNPPGTGGVLDNTGRPPVMSNQTVSVVLRAIERIGPLIAGHAAAAEADRQLSGTVYRAMYDAGLFAMLAPKAYGGLELHPVEACRSGRPSRGSNSAAAWNLVMNQAIAAYAAWLPAEGARELFRDGPPTTAGALNPPAAARRVDGGWRITGQVPFGSGCHHAQWLAMPAAEMEDGRPKVDPATGSRRSSASSSRAPRPRFWTRGIRSACAAPDRPTTPCAICSCRIA